MRLVFLTENRQFHEAFPKSALIVEAVVAPKIC